MANDKVMAVDIGATKMATAVVDRDGQLLSRNQSLTPRDADAEHIFETLVNTINECTHDYNINTIGVSCAGPMEPGGATVSPLSITGWRNFPLKQQLQDYFQLPVFIDGDAKALALGEKWKGAAQHSDNFIAMVVSSGVGGGIILDGKLLDGRLGNAGHIGHVIVEPNGRQCSCGARGCMEAETSGLSIEAMTGRPPKQATAEIIERTGTLVGRGIASVANLLDLDLALIGGSVALGFGDPFFQAAQGELDRSCGLTFSSGTKVMPVGLGAEGPILGAAAVGFKGVNQL